MWLVPVNLSDLLALIKNYIFNILNYDDYFTKIIWQVSQYC